MKTQILKITIIGIFALGLTSTSLLADTIFVGIEGAGAVQLRENLQISAISNLGEAVDHLAIGSTSNGITYLYCAHSNKLSILDASTLKHIKTINMPGEIRAMKLRNGILYLLVANQPAEVVLISEPLQKIIGRIEVGKIKVYELIQQGYGIFRLPRFKYVEPVDMAVTSDGKKIYLAIPGESIINVVYVKRVDTGYGVFISGELVNSIFCGGNPCSLALSNDRGKLYAAESKSSQVIVIDTSIDKIIKRIRVGIECVKVCPAGANIYAIDKSPLRESSNIWAVHIINTMYDNLTGSIKINNVPFDAAYHPEGNYSIITSCKGNKIYKVMKAQAADGTWTWMINEKSLPSPRSALIISRILGRPKVIYSDGKEIQGTTYSLPVEKMASMLSSDYSALSGSSFTVWVIFPNGFENDMQKLNGTQFVQWETEPFLNPYLSTAKIKCIIDGKVIDLHHGSIPNDYLYEWHTEEFGIDSKQCKIKVYVDDGIHAPVSDDSDYYFALDNTPPVIKIEEPSELDYVVGSNSITVKAKIRDELFNVEQSTIKLKINGVAVATTPTPLSDNIYKWSNVSIPGGTPPIEIEVIAKDELGNEGSDIMVLRNSREIQAAIDGALPGETISIEPGIYIFTSDLRVTKNIKIEASDTNVDKTVLRLGDYCIFVKDIQFYGQNEYYYQLFKYVNDVTIDGVTIKGYRGQSREGAIQNYAGKLTLKDCKIIDNEGIKVGAIYSCWMSKLYLENTLIAKNKNKANTTTSVAPYSWRFGQRVYCGAIYLAGTATLNATSSTIADNINDSQPFTIVGRYNYDYFVDDGLVHYFPIEVRYGAVYRNYQNALTMTNSIMWGNGKDREVIGTEAQDFMHKDHRQIDVDITYSDLESTSIYMPGEPVNPTQYYVPPIRRYQRIIHEYPEFIDPLTYNYNISDTSPCRGMGEDGADIGAKF